jgi:hypothetical protein
MGFSANGAVLPGTIKTTITQARGHEPQAWAQMAANKIIAIGDQAPMPIREQAHAFKARIAGTIAHTVSQACHEQLVYLALDLERAGMKDAAALVRSRFHEGST